MPDPDLTPDCARCDALCCVLPAFDALQSFGFDKPACVACRNLAPDNACRVHANLIPLGFRGCVVFDCHGAGQRVTSQVFKGRSWRDDPTLMQPMENAFRVMRRLHQAVVLLTEAAKLPLPPEQQRARQDLLATLDAGRDWTEAALADLEAGPHLAAVTAYLAQLRSVRDLSPTRR